VTRRARARIAAGSLLAMALLLPALILLEDPAREREPPDAAAEAAAAGLAAARTAGATAVAPVNLGQAEDAYAEALLERRRQELRPGLLRDFRTARALFLEATTWADRATTLAVTARRRERTRGERALTAARRALAPLEGVENHLWLPAEVRGRLQRARALTFEGSGMVAGGAFADAERKAHEAQVAAQAVSRAVWAATRRYADEQRLRTWRAWSAETVAWSARTGRAAIVVDKDEHRLTLYQGGKVVRRYRVELGWNNAGEKSRQGDGATPEGRYRIVDLKGRARSRYHRALLLDYPNREDLRALDRMKVAGAVPAGARAGGLIEIHGAGGRGRDWTDGCVAVTNAEIEELYRRVAVGTPVTIVGSGTGAGVFADIARRVARGS
jgi:lipoprotein-anchoring transpeptidase ErfK/SrfK